MELDHAVAAAGEEVAKGAAVMKEKGTYDRFAEISAERRMRTENDLKASYSSESRGFVALAQEMFSLYRLHTEGIENRVQERLEDARQVQSRVKKLTGLVINDLDVLEIGPGQFPIQLIYFANNNRAVGIDSDVIVDGYNPLRYFSMLRINGLRRTVKTILRKFLGIDRKYKQKLMRSLCLDMMPAITIDRMDVRCMSFKDQSFDFIYSRSVLHQLEHPGAAVDEIIRVLRKDGVAYITIHPFTSASGCLDPRIYTARRGEVDGWPHLRANLQSNLLPANVRLNRLRLVEWRRLFSERMPGVVFLEIESSDVDVMRRAKALHAQGQLLDYSLQELGIGEFVAIWKKPLAGC